MERRSGPDRRRDARPTGDRRGPGRPPRIDGEHASERVWLRLTPAEREALKAAAQENGEPVGVLLRNAVNAYVADFSEREVFVTCNSDPPAD